jgi:G3E family GTPase
LYCLRLLSRGGREKEDNNNNNNNNQASKQQQRHHHHHHHHHQQQIAAEAAYLLLPQEPRGSVGVCLVRGSDARRAIGAYVFARQWVVRGRDVFARRPNSDAGAPHNPRTIPYLYASRATEKIGL